MPNLTISSTVDEIARQEPLVGAFLLGLGLVFLLMGLRLGRPLVALSFAVVGFVLGASVSGPDAARIGLGMVAAFGLGAASLWLMRPAVAVLAGMWAALCSTVVLGHLGVDPQVNMIVAAVLFAGAASLSFVSISEIIAMVTSLEGTILMLAGLIVLCNQSASTWHHLRGLLVNNPIFTPFLLISGTVAGLYTQLAELQKKQSGHSA